MLEEEVGKVLVSELVGLDYIGGRYCSVHALLRLAFLSISLSFFPLAGKKK